MNWSFYFIPFIFKSDELILLFYSLWGENVWVRVLNNIFWKNKNCVFSQKMFWDAISHIWIPPKMKMLPFLGCYMKNQKMHVNFFWESNRVSIYFNFLFCFLRDFLLFFQVFSLFHFLTIAKECYSEVEMTWRVGLNFKIFRYEEIEIS